MTKANEDRRQNPEVRAEVRRVLEERKRVLDEATELSKQITKMLDSAPYVVSVGDAPMFDDARSAAWRLQTQILRANTFDTFTETYIGNKAAFDLGEAIEADLAAGGK